MKGKISLLTRKIFATVIAVAMSIPPTAFANANEPVVYTENSSIMGIRENKEELPRIENTDKTKLSKDLGSYNLEIKANLDPSLTKINYTIKAKRKEKLAEDKQGKLSLSLTKTPSSNLNDLQLISANTENQTNEPDFKAEGLPSLVITSKAKDEIIYELSADVNKAKDQRSYKLILSLAEEGAKSEVLSYNLKVEKELTLKDGEEVETVELVNEDDESPLIKGEYKKEGILGGLFASQDSITWEAFILNEEENQEITYDFNLDKNQDPTNSKIAIDYYEPTDKGFEIKREFSQTIDFAKKIKFEIPRGHLAKLTLKTKVSKKNTKVKSYSLNNGVVKNPIYIEGNEEEKSNDDEEPAQKEENKKYQKDPTDQGTVEVKPSEIKPESKPEAKPQGKDSQTQIIATDSSGKEIKIEEKNQPVEENKKPQISALILNRDSLIARLKAENKLTSQLETAIADLADILNSYNEEKITDQDLKDFTKSLAERNQLAKADLKSYLEAILSGLNKQTNRAANINYDEIITYAYPEKKEAKPQDKKPEAKKNEGQKAEEKPAPSKESQEKTPPVKKEEPKANQEDKPLQNEKSEAVKTFDKDLASLKEEAKKEPAKKSGIFEGLKSLLGQTDLQKADRELKKALADKKNTLEDIQKLLDSFKTKYKLSKADQAKLMDDNGDAIRALIEKDKDTNIRPSMLFDMGPNQTYNPVGAGQDRSLTQEEIQNLENKKFTIMTRFDTSNANGPIQPGQFFKIHLDDELMVKNVGDLPPLKYNGKEITDKPTYNSRENTLTYTIKEPIAQNIQVPVVIPVDYNTRNIKLRSDETFVVINKVSGLGLIDPPKDLLPQRVDKNGNLVGSIIEPGRKDVTNIIESDKANYKVYTDASANPVVKDGELKGYNWTIKISSDTNLADLGYMTNFTTVKGSGLGKISDASVTFEDNPIANSFGINDSKHHEPKEGREVTYKFFTPITNKQESYMLDISVIVKKYNKTGAKRIIISEGYDKEKVEEATPTRVGINNRTTIRGEFASDSTATWTVTDGVSTGDDGKLPLATRTLDTKQNQTSNTVKVYGLNDQGQMVEQSNDLTDNKKVGTIAVYEYKTNLDTSKSYIYTLGGVGISKSQDIKINQSWWLENDLTMPKQDIQVVDANNHERVLGEAHVAKSETYDTTRSFVIENTRVWSIDNEGNATREKILIKQDLPKSERIGWNGTANYFENINYYDKNEKAYYIRNSATMQILPRFANVTVLKLDSKTDKPLEGARFKLSGELEATTNEEGKAVFSNVKPGSYVIWETKAPDGYKLPSDGVTINVDNNGNTRLVSSGAELKVGENTTKLVQDKQWPGYMNSMHYATKDSAGNVTTYILLKPNSGDTNKTTRLSLVTNDMAPLNNKTDVEIYDVDPKKDRAKVKEAMNNQAVDDTLLKSLGNNRMNVEGWHPITGEPNVRDSFTNKTGYQIKIPQQRFDGDWAFLIKVNGKTNGENPHISYDWLTDTNTANNSKLVNNQVIPEAESNKNKEATLTIKNEAFEKRPVEIKKLTKDKDPVAGATFVIKDAKTKKIISTVTSSSETGKEGLASFGNLPEGNYVIEEIAAPEGYIKSDVIFDVTVDKSKQVTYKPRLKKGSGDPINGDDYFIKDIEHTDNTDTNIDVIEQKLILNEGSGDIGTKKGVWEAYRLESLKYTAKIKLSRSIPGERFSIQFDPNLDFTQYFGEFPKININGVDVADPYFDYTTNKLTYVFNEKSAGGQAVADLNLVGIIPSKYYAQNDGTYTFTVKVAPDRTNVQNQTTSLDVKADYGRYDYDSKNIQPSQSYYFRDVYKEGNDWYVKALAYYNPQYLKRNSEEKELTFNWLSTSYQGTNINFFDWEGKGDRPAFSLHDVKVYRTSPKMGQIDEFERLDKKWVNYNMPLSFGVRPEKDPATYNLIYSRAIDPKDSISNDTQGSITLNYNPNQIQSWGKITNNAPLRIKMPAINDKNKSGYIIEQTFKIDDLYKFNNLWRVFLMNNNGFKSSFITRANYSKAFGDQTTGEIPKFFSQEVGLINKKYVPGHFRIKKLDDTNRNKGLEGANFSLRDENKNFIYRPSDSNGIVNFDNLKPGIYTLREENAPKNYVKSDNTWRVNVGIDGNITIVDIGLGSSGDIISGNDILLEVTNRPEATEFKVYKKDDKGQPLPGAEFTITTKEGTLVETSTSDGNGVVSFKKLNANNTYIIEETKAPAGYKKLGKKWVIEVDANGKAKVYNYTQTNTQGTDPNVSQSILNEVGTKWVNVGKRPTYGFIFQDNRNQGYYNNYPTPYKLGTRIVAKNTTGKYVIQRYVINPEGDTLTLKNASIHREKLNYTNMNWYAGNGTFKIFELNRPVDGNVEDIRLENYSINDITSSVTASTRQISGQNRLYLDFNNKQTSNPIIVDVKVPYFTEAGGVGTGMDLATSKDSVLWKSDYYEKASDIVEGEPVQVSGQGGNIKGGYVSDDFLDVSNDKEVHEFKFKKLGDQKNQQGGFDALSGATFSLQGPKKNDNELGPKVWKKSGDDGMVRFDNLVPGIYKLVETGAAQGYESSNTDWTVTITKDGKTYIRDNNPGNKVPETKAQWQKVKAGTKGNVRGSSTVQGTPVASRLDTRITEVNPKAKKFRQVYIINKQAEDLSDPYFEIHAQEENRSLNLSNTDIVSLVKVGWGSTPENLINPGEAVVYDKTSYVKNEGKERIKIIPKNLSGEQTLALTIETELPNSGTIGTGIDFYNYGTNHYWLTEYYDSYDKIQLEPAPSTTTDKSANLYVGGERVAGSNSIMQPSDSSSNKPVLYRQQSGLMDRNLRFRSLGSEDIYFADPIQPFAFRSASLNNFGNDGFEISDNLFGGPVGAGNLSQTSYNIDSSDANITVTAEDVNTTDGTRNINISVSPKEGTNPGSTKGKNLQYVFMIDRSRDQALNIKTADTPTIDKNINKFLTDLAEKAKNTNTSVDVTFIEYSKNGSRVLGSYNQNLVDLYNSANSFTYNMKTQRFNDRNNVTAKDILGSLGISSRTNVTNKDKDDGSQVLNGNIGSYYNQIVGNGKKYDKKYVLNVANFDAATATYYLENPNNPYSTKKYYAAENNWIFRDTTKPVQDRFESYVLHISQKEGKTGYETYMSTNSGTLRYEKDTTTTTNGIYTYKNFLESNLIKNEDFQSSGQVEEYLVKNAKIDINLNPNIRLAANPSADKGNISYTSDGFSINNINLKKGQTLNLSYKIGLDSTAQSNQDYQIHGTMLYTPNNSNPVNLDNNLATRRNLESYIVTLIANNGSGQTTKKSVNKGDYYFLPQCDFTAPSGQEFDYWLVFGQKHQPGDEIQITENTNVIAFWKTKETPQTYTITTKVVDNTGGSILAQPNAKPNEIVRIQINPGAGHYSLVDGQVNVRTSDNSPVPVSYDEQGPYFTMPASDVTVSGEFQKASRDGYVVRIQDPANGSVTANQYKAWSGTEITLTPSPAQGYKLKSLFAVSNGKLVQITDNKFTMPDGDVYVIPTFEPGSEPQKFAITTTVTEGQGTLTADPTSQEEGKPVTITVKPAKGYEVGQVTVNGTNVARLLDSNGQYTFNMEGGKVNVVATFNPINVQKYYIAVNTDPRINFNLDLPGQVKQAPVGSKVTFKALLGESYDNLQIKEVKVNGSQGEPKVDVDYDKITGKGSFIMPAYNVSISFGVKPLPASTRRQETTSTETIPHEREVKVDDTLKPGEYKVDQQGQDGSRKYKYVITFDKENEPEEPYPLGWPTDLKATFDAMKQSGERIAGYSRAVLSESAPITEKIRVGKSDDPVDMFVPEKGRDILVNDENNASAYKPVEITNQKSGIILNIFKKSGTGKRLPNAEFILRKYKDNTFEVEDTTFKQLKATSDKDGKVTFTDQAGNDVKLKEGFYKLTETKAPVGYKKITADWKIEVKNDKGRIYAEYKGPEDTPSTLINDNKKTNGTIDENQFGMNSNSEIKYKTRLIHINPESNTFVQRILIDTRGYYRTHRADQLLNLQIKPKYKREEIDTPGQPPVTIQEGVKTAYRTTYKLIDPTKDKELNRTDGKPVDYDKILRTYDLSNSNMEMINTARWRPFDWGFDEDQLNLGKGVYLIDVEGYYDNAIITGWAENEVDPGNDYIIRDKNGKEIKDLSKEIPKKKTRYNRTTLPTNDPRYINPADLGKIQLHIDFYEGKREFRQLVVDKDGHGTYESFDKASYQGGAAQLTKYLFDRYGKDEAEKWSGSKPAGNKYANFVGKKVKIGNLEYETGRIYPSLDNVTPIERDSETNIGTLYNSNKAQEIPKNGMDVVNDQETYNITFSKHGRDDPKLGDNSKDVTNNRLEGAVFKLQIEGPGGIFEDMDGTYVASAFNGFFGFRGLAPGRYRLMEVQAPKGYRPIKDPILHMTIAYSEEDITIVDKKDPSKNRIIPRGGYITLEYNKDASGIIQYAPELKDKDGKPITPEEGKLLDFVTSATAKNMGKIINEKPGKGEVTILKKDEMLKALNGAKFELRRLTADTEVKPGETSQSSDRVIDKGVVGITTDSEGKKVKGEDGKLVFKDLPIGNYELVETEPAPGHQNEGKRWYFTVGGPGLDPYANDASPLKDNLTDKLTLNSTFKVQKTLSNDDSNVSENNIVYPHRAQSIGFENEFKLADDQRIKPGDYFDIKLSDSIDLVGIYKTKPLSNLDIFADGVGTIAKAYYDKDKGTIRYVFTEYAKTYTLKNFKTSIVSWINLDKIKKSQSVPIGMRLNPKGSQDSYHNEIYVNYDILRETSKRYYSYWSGNYDWWGNPVYVNAYHNLTGKIVELDKDSGEFKQYYYINRMQQEGYPKKWKFKYTPFSDYPDKALDSAKIRVFKLRNNSNVADDMPESFSVDDLDSNQNLKPVFNKSYTDFKGTTIEFSKDDGTGSEETDSYIVEVTGKIPADSVDAFETAGEIYIGKTQVAARWDKARFATNTTQARAKLEITAINPKNQIIFRKVNQAGRALKGAEFALVKKDLKGNYQEETGTTKKTGEDGLVKYELLDPGEYALIEKKAPPGYNPIDGYIVEFTVGKNGVITRKVEIAQPNTNNSATNAVSNMFKALMAGPNGGDGNDQKPPKPVTQTVEEQVGAIPIDVVNNKIVEFKKVDATDKDRTLANATFEVWYNQNEAKNYQQLKVKVKENGVEKEEVLKATSDSSGKFSLNIAKPGYYALKEITAPDGYQLPTDFVKEFRISNEGNVQTLEKTKANISKVGDTSISDYGNMKTELLSFDAKTKTFKQRILINPDHKKYEFDSGDTQLRFLEDKWEIIPRQNKELNFNNYSVGVIKYAVLDKGKSINDLTYDTQLPGTRREINGFDVFRYNIASMYGSSNYIQPNPRSSYAYTEKTLVIEYEGKVKDNEHTPFRVEQDIQSDTYIRDSISSPLDIGDFTKDKEDYVDLKIPDGKAKPDPMVIENEPARVDFGFVKKDSVDNTTLEGAVFRIEKYDHLTDTYKKIDQNGNFLADADQNDKSKHGWTETSDNQGKFKFKELRDGRYRIVEIKAPDGYKIDDDPVKFKFEVDHGKTYQDMPNSDPRPELTTDKDIYNDKNGIYFEKVDAVDHNTKLDGAVFELQKKNGDTYESIDKSGNLTTDDKDKWRETSDGQGKFKFEKIPDGEYQVYEIKAPKDYSLLERVALKFKVVNGKIYKFDKANNDYKTTELVGTNSRYPNSEAHPIIVENHKAELPKALGTGNILTYTLAGLAVMLLGIYVYYRKKKVVA